MVTVNVVVLAGTVAAEPVARTMPSGDEVTELRISVPEVGRRHLPLPVAAWHATVGAGTVGAIAKGDPVLVHGQLVRRFYRSGAGEARGAWARRGRDGYQERLERIEHVLGEPSPSRCSDWTRTASRQPPTPDSAS